MPLTWKLGDWWRGTSMKRRLRRQMRRTRLPVESLEQRVVPAATGSVSGVAFIDANGNGVKDFVDLNQNNTHDADEDELVVRGTTLHLTGKSDAGDTVNAQVITDQQGAFTFTVVPAGTYTLKADRNAVISGTLGNGVSVHVGTTSVTQDVPIDGIVVTSDLLLNTSPPITDAITLDNFPLPTAGTGQSTGINEAPTLRNGQPADVNVAQNASPTSVDLTGVFDDPNIATSQIQIHTNNGDINVDLLDKDAPQTVQNFYNYVNSGAYDNSIFHRLVSGFVLQGGGFKYNAKDDSTTPVTPASITAITAGPAVKNEFDGVNRSNVAGTVAMAKLGSDPNSATDQFFFNLADNHANLDNQNGGFTVFGRLVGPADIAVVNGLANTTSPSTIKLFDASNASGVTASVRSALDNLPLKNYANGVAKTTAEINATNPPNPNNKTGSTFPVDTTAANFLEITGITTIVRDEVLTYSIVSNSNAALVTPTITNNRLTLTYAAGQTGVAAIVVRATDKQGLTTDATIQVRVGAPRVTALALAPISPQPASTITATATVTDPNSQTPNLTYVWKVNGTAVKTTAATTSHSDTLVLGTDATVAVGDVVSVDVTPSDTIATGSTVTSSKTIVANSAPSIASVSLSPNQPTADTPLTATVSNATDANSDPISFTYAWKRNGSGLVTHTTSNTTDTLALGTDVIVQPGDTISVEVTPNDGQLNGTVKTDSTTVDQAPTASVSLSPDNPGATDTLTATVIASDPDTNDAIDLTYVWKVNGTTVKATSDTSSTTDTLVLGTDTTVSSGDVVSVEVIPTDGQLDGTMTSDNKTVV